MDKKRAFNIDAVIRRIRVAVAGFADAAMFDLADDGYRSVFEQVVACIISIRTRDEEMVVAARRLFDVARTPDAIARLTISKISELIKPSAFREAKAKQIRTIAERTVAEFGGELPCDFDVLTSLGGVGPKCAALALGIACGQKHIGVDVHVHRVTNRWGYVQTSAPERTRAALMERLPQVYWIEINRLLVPFGKHVCTGVRPKCSTCPVLEYCRQVGVTTHR